MGYFFDSIPYLGFEGEGSIASNNRPQQQVTVKPPISNAPVYTEAQGNLIWTMALHIVGRYGFLPDKEVPFGEVLQTLSRDWSRGGGVIFSERFVQEFFPG